MVTCPDLSCPVLALRDTLTPATTMCCYSGFSPYWGYFFRTVTEIRTRLEKDRHYLCWMWTILLLLFNLCRRLMYPPDPLMFTGRVSEASVAEVLVWGNREGLLKVHRRRWRKCSLSKRASLSGLHSSCQLIISLSISTMPALVTQNQTLAASRGFELVIFRQVVVRFHSFLTIIASRHLLPACNTLPFLLVCVCVCAPWC